MSFAEAIHLKRLKRKRIKEARMRSWGSVFNHRSMFPDQYRAKIFPTVLPIAHRRERGIISRFINWLKSFFV
mgnify:CR=1 FL=1